MTPEQRLGFAIAFAERIVDIGGSTGTAIRVAAAQYDVDRDALLKATGT